MKIRLTASFFLRLGLAATFFYSGIDIILHSTSWVSYIPFWFKEFLSGIGIDPLLYLKIQGGAEILFAVSFLTGIVIRAAALLVALEMAAILLFFGIDGVTFRDFGILGGALALFFANQEKRMPTSHT